jgi:hypothetical protein
MKKRVGSNPETALHADPTTMSRWSYSLSNLNAPKRFDTVGASDRPVTVMNRHAAFVVEPVHAVNTSPSESCRALMRRLEPRVLLGSRTAHRREGDQSFVINASRALIVSEPDEISSKATDLTCQVVSAGAALQPDAMNAHTNPTAESRLFFTCRCRRTGPASARGHRNQ